MEALRSILAIGCMMIGGVESILGNRDEATHFYVLAILLFVV